MYKVRLRAKTLILAGGRYLEEKPRTPKIPAGQSRCPVSCNGVKVSQKSTSILMTTLGLAPQSNCLLHKTMNSLKSKGTLGSLSSVKLR